MTATPVPKHSTSSTPEPTKTLFTHNLSAPSKPTYRLHLISFICKPIYERGLSWRGFGPQENEHSCHKVADAAQLSFWLCFLCLRAPAELCPNPADLRGMEAGCWCVLPPELLLEGSAGISPALVVQHKAKPKGIWLCTMIFLLWM